MAAKYPEEKMGDHAQSPSLDQKSHKMLKKNINRLKERLRLSGALWAELRGLGVCTMKDQHTFKLNASKSEEAMRLVHHIMNGDRRRYDLFRKALENAGQGRIVTEVLDKEDPTGTGEDLVAPARGEMCHGTGDDCLPPLEKPLLKDGKKGAHRSSGLLDEKTRDMLNAKRAALVDCLTVGSYMWVSLKALRVCTDQVKQTIQLNATEFEQADRLIDHILKGDRKRYDQFRRVLIETKQEHIVTEILDKEEEGIGDDNQVPTLEDLRYGQIHSGTLHAAIEVYRQWLLEEVMVCARLEGHERQPDIDVRKRFKTLKLLDNDDPRKPLDELPDILEENLFEPLKQTNKPILWVLVEGAPGSGKTTLCRHWVCQWADPKQREEISFLNTRNLVILIECRAHKGCLREKIWHALPETLSRSQKVALCQFFYQHPAECQCVPDAVDEIPISEATQLFQELQRLQVSVLTTTRSNKVNDLIGKFDRLIIVAGFKLENALEFVESVLRDENKSPEQIKLLMAHVHDNVDTYTNLLETPQNCVMTALKLSLDKELSATVSMRALYTTVEDCLIQRECARRKKKVDGAVRQDQRRLYHMAFVTLMKQEVLVSPETLETYQIDESSPVMVLLDKTCLITVGTQISWQPSHKSWLEHLGSRRLAALDPGIRDQMIIYLSASRDYDNLLRFTFGILQENQKDSAVLLLQSTLLIQASSIIDLVDPSLDTSCRGNHPTPNLTDVHRSVGSVKVGTIQAAAGDRDHQQTPLQLTPAVEFIRAWYRHAWNCQCRERWLQKYQATTQVTSAMQRLFVHVRDCAKEAGGQYEHMLDQTFRLIFDHFSAGSGVTEEPGLVDVRAHSVPEAARLLTTLPRTTAGLLRLHVPSPESIAWWGEPPAPTAAAWSSLVSAVTAQRQVTWLTVHCGGHRADGLLRTLGSRLGELMDAVRGLGYVEVYNPRLHDTREVGELLAAVRALGPTRRGGGYRGLEVEPCAGRWVELVVWGPSCDDGPGAAWWQDMKATGLVALHGKVKARGQTLEDPKDDRQ